MKEEENADDKKTEEEEENIPGTPPKSKARDELIFLGFNSRIVKN